MVVLEFGTLYGGEWQATAQNVAPVILAIMVFAFCIAGVAYWKGK